MKLFCCGITSNELEKITDLVEKTKDYVDGLIWCVDSNPNSDSTFNYLEKNKKDGEIIRHRWVNDHGGQMNEFLQSPKLKNGYWVLCLDSSEVLTEGFLKDLNGYIDKWNKEYINAVFCSGRPYLFKFFDYLYLFGTPHWGLQGLRGEYVVIPEEEKSKYIINKRNLNPTKHYCWHNTKYYLYGRSNQMQLIYGKYGPEIIEKQEQQRIKFRLHLEELGVPLTLDGLENYFKQGEYTNEFINIVEDEFCLSEFFQTKILNMDFMETGGNGVHPRYRWSFKTYLKTSQINQKELGYKGKILTLNEKFGIKDE